MRVEIYRNLTKDCWSIRHRGKVVGHAKSVVIHNPEFVVSAAGRERVLRERRKNVHAVVRGELVSFDEATTLEPVTSVTYNPYYHEKFTSDGRNIDRHEGYATLDEAFRVRLS